MKLTSKDSATTFSTNRTAGDAVLEARKAFPKASYIGREFVAERGYVVKVEMPMFAGFGHATAYVQR